MIARIGMAVALCACSTGSASGETPAPPASAIPRAAPGASGADYPAARHPDQGSPPIVGERPTIPPPQPHAAPPVYLEPLEGAGGHSGTGL